MPANQDDRDALLPCPFCGGRADTLHEKNFGHWRVEVVCVRCGSRTGNRHNDADAIAAWNQRAGFTRSAKDEGWVATSPRQFEAMANELAKRISENVRLAAEVKLFRTFADAKACRNVDNALPAPPIATPPTQADAGEGAAGVEG